MDKHQSPFFEAETGCKELLYQLVNNVRDCAIFLTDTDASIVSWNVGAERLFGYGVSEAMGRNAEFLFTPEDRAVNIPIFEMETAIREGISNGERWLIRKDGTRFLSSGLQTPLFNKAGEHTGYAKIVRDLTELAEAQRELLDALDSVETRVRQRTSDLNVSNEALEAEVGQRKESERVRTALLHKIVQTQENERKRIARDIHDHIGQGMTGLQLRLHALQDTHRENAAITAELKSLSSIAHQIETEVDFLAWELRPSVLDDLGLCEAIERYIADWQKQFNTRAEFICIGREGLHLSPDYEINLYRLVQEALNNAAKHASATSVSVMLELKGQVLTLIIEDDGKGFETNAAAVITGNDRGLGLLGMKERAELFGGTIEIESAPGKGTAIFVRVPAIFDHEIRPNHLPAVRPGRTVQDSRIPAADLANNVGA
jgi:PAS domain S-box-containing protein